MPSLSKRPNPLRMDPTRTAALRRKFETELIARFERLKAKLRKYLLTDDKLELKALVGNARFKFNSKPERIEEFRQWLATQVQDEILGDPNSNEAAWWDKFIQEGYRQGAGRAFDDTKKPYARGYAKRGSDLSDFYKGTKYQFLQSSFAQPETVEKVQLLASRVFTELKGVTDAMSQKMARDLTEGLSRGDNPYTIAKQLSSGVDSVGEVRARAIARTECLPGETLVDSAVVRAVFRRWYEGDMIHIKTRSGSKFSATPNHPMLTKDGWVNAGLLKQGDNLVSHNREQDFSSSSNVDNKHSPLTLSEIFDSLNDVGIFERVPTCKHDFHSDGRDGNVDILRPTRELEIGVFSSITKPLAEEVFSPAGQSTSTFCSLCSRLLSINEQTCFCCTPQLNTSVLETELDSVSITSESITQGDYGFPILVSGDNLSGINVVSELVSLSTFLPRVVRGIGERPTYSSLSQDFSNSLLIGPDFSGNLPLSHPSQVKLDDIVSVTVRPFAGHVYNLETPYGYYTIEGYYTGNTVRAHNEGQLDSLESLGVDEIGVMVEWSTAMNACKLCQPMEGVVFTIKEARGMLPRHVNCRCAYLPSNVGESTTGQKRGKAAIEKAIDESVAAELPKTIPRTLEEQKEKTSWQGVDKNITPERPKPVVSPMGSKEPPPPPVKTEVPPTPPVPVAPAAVPVPVSQPTAEKTLKERIADPKLEEMRVEFLGNVTKAQAKKDKLDAEANDKFKEYMELSSRIGNWAQERDKYGDIVYQIVLDDLRKDQAALEEAWNKLNKQSQAVQEDLTIKALKKSIKLPEKHQMDLIHAKPIETTNCEGKAIKTLKQGNVFKGQAKKAKEFLADIIPSDPSQFIDGKLNVLVHQLPDGERAFYKANIKLSRLFTNEPIDNPKSGVHMERGDGVHTHIHEIGHQVEREMKGVKDKAIEFRNMRIAEAGTKPVKMSELCPHCNYADHEIGNPDGWGKTFGENHAAYIGKDYGDHATEVISMGVEMLYKDPVKFAQNDPEYFKFIVGVLRGDI